MASSLVAERARLLELLKDRSWRRGTVTLASGKTSDFYIDTKQTSLHAEGSALIGALLFEHVQGLRKSGIRCDAIGGLTLGADPLGTACSLVSFQQGAPLHAFIIRKEPKEHGTQQWVEGAKNVGPGSHVVIVEDVVTTGGSTQKAIDRAKESGLVPVAIIAIVDRNEGGRENLAKNNLPFAALYTRADFVA